MHGVGELGNENAPIDRSSNLIVALRRNYVRIYAVLARPNQTANTQTYKNTVSAAHTIDDRRSTIANTLSYTWRQKIRTRPVRRHRRRRRRHCHCRCRCFEGSSGTVGCCGISKARRRRIHSWGACTRTAGFRWWTGRGR